MNAPEILNELSAMGLTFRAEGQRLVHKFKPKGPVDSAKMGNLLYSLNRYHWQALDYLREHKNNQGEVIPFRKRGAL